MKKTFLGVAMLAALCFSFTTVDTAEVINTHIDSKGSSITLINDTGDKVRVHTGSGETSLNPKGGKTSFSCNPGKKVKVDGSYIFTVKESMCGTTIYLSDYI